MVRAPPEPIPGETEGGSSTPYPRAIDLGERGLRLAVWVPGQATVAQFPELLRARRGSLCFLKISKQPLTTRSLQPTRRQSFTLCRTSHSQPNLRSQALRHFQSITFCLVPSFPCALLCTCPLHSDQCEEAKLSPTEGKEWTLIGPPAPLTTRLSQPHSLFFLTLLQHRSQHLSRNIARTSSCACDNLAPSYNHPSFVLSPLSTQPSPPLNTTHLPCPRDSANHLHNAQGSRCEGGCQGDPHRL